MKPMKTTFIIIAIVATAGFGSLAFAHGGWGGYGYGGHMMGYGGGYAMGPGMMGYGPGYGQYGRREYPADLTKSDRDQLQQAQDKFITETRTLENQIRDKQIALDDELDSATPDKAKVIELQKTISRLQSDFDQKALEYRLEVRTILPENTTGPYGYGPGYGGCAW